MTKWKMKNAVKYFRVRSERISMKSSRKVPEMTQDLRGRLGGQEGRGETLRAEARKSRKGNAQEPTCLSEICLSCHSKTVIACLHALSQPIAALSSQLMTSSQEKQITISAIPPLSEWLLLLPAPGSSQMYPSAYLAPQCLPAKEPGSPEALK